MLQIWTTIALLSALGCTRPLDFSPLLLLILMYKVIWLSLAVVPQALAGRPYPKIFSAMFLA